MNSIIDKINKSFLNIILNLPKNDLLDLYNYLNTEYYNGFFKKNTVQGNITDSQTKKEKSTKEIDKSEFILKTYLYDILLSSIKSKKIILDLTADKSNIDKKNN